MGDSSHSVEDNGFPTPFLSSCKGHMLLQDNINLRRESVKKGSHCKVMNNQGLLQPAGPLFQFETLRAARLNQEGEVLEFSGVVFFHSRTLWCVQSDEGMRGAAVHGETAYAETCDGERVAA